MIAGIVTFAFVATSVAFGSPCGGFLSNGISGNVVGLSNSGLTGGLIGSGLASLASPIGVRSSVVATPSAISPSFSSSVSGLGSLISAPIAPSFGTVVGTGREVVATESVVPAYSTLVNPSASASLGVSSIVGQGSACGSSLASGISSFGSSSFVPSVASAPVSLSSGIVSSPIIETSFASPSVVSSPLVGSSFASPSVVSSPLVGSSFASPSIVSSPLSVGSSCGSSSILSSDLGSSLFRSSGLSSVGALAGSSALRGQVGRSIISAPIVEPTNVATPVVSSVSSPVVSGGLLSSGVSLSGSSFGGIQSGVCGC